MKTTTKQILNFMNVIAWIAFIGLSIETGAVLLSFIVSLFNPEAAKNLYLDLNLFELLQYNIWHYAQAVSFIVSLLAMKALVAYLVIRTLSKVKLKKPFTLDVVRKMEIISCLLFGIWLVTLISIFHEAYLKLLPIIERKGATGEFLLFAALIYIFSQIFKRGVELQTENELTV